MKKMVDKKVEDEIKNLFLKKKYEEVIQFSEKYTVPYKRPSSLSNLIGISKIVKKKHFRNRCSLCIRFV